MSGSRNPNLGLTAVGSDDQSGESWRKNLGRSGAYLGLPRWDDWWTGLAPEICPGFEDDGKLHSLPMVNQATCTRQEVLDYFNNTWTLNELLFSSLIGDEPFYRPPYHALRHPLIFYYVHPSVLYVSKLRLAGLMPGPINPYFESLFETGVDEMSWDDMSKNAIEWPSIDDAQEYRRKVYGAVRAVIESHPDLADGHKPILQDHPLWALFMGFEHERIHLETSSVLIRELPVHLVSRPEHWPEHAPLDVPGVGAAGKSQSTASGAAFPPKAGRSYPQNTFIPLPAQDVRIGKPANTPFYGWDNEYGERTAHVGAFEAGQYLVSNGEYWQFVADGGYHDEANWTETGWRWRNFRNVKWPTFWVPDGPAGAHQYRLRTGFEIVPMQWSWPAVVNYHEASAFCHWKSQKDGRSYRLITEAEHHALRAGSDSATGNLNLAIGSESPVNGEISRTEGQFYDVFGNVWQWAEDHFNKLDGFKVHPYYDDFSTPCFDGQHQMIMGGSFVSTGDEASVWARFHFRPHFFQHAGFRLVHAPDGGDGAVVHLQEGAGSNKYDSERIFNEYMTLHFGSPELQMPFASGPVEATCFPQRCADILTEWCRKLNIKTGRALDIGCSVGGATFRLAESFDEVTGVDLSEQFIKAAKDLKANKTVHYNCKIEGDIHSAEQANVDSKTAARAEFRQADACALPAEYVDFDAVLMANLLCRLPNPASCMRRMWGSRGIVRPGGLLMTVEPFSWQESFTQKDLWLGGYETEEGPQFSEIGLTELLSEGFELLDTFEVPLVIREHRRKFQYITPQAMIWRRKSN